MHPDTNISITTRLAKTRYIIYLASRQTNRFPILAILSHHIASHRAPMNTPYPSKYLTDRERVIQTNKQLTIKKPKRRGHAHSKGTSLNRTNSNSWRTQCEPIKAPEYPSNQVRYKQESSRPQLPSLYPPERKKNR